MNPQPVVLASGDTSIYAETLEQCLKSTWQFHGTLVQNICDGGTYYIPNGFWDYAVLIIGMSILAGIALFIFFGLLRIIFD